MNRILKLSFLTCLISALISIAAYAAKPVPATITVTVTTDKAAYSAGETAVTTAVAKYSSGSPVTSIKSATITIKDSAGATRVNAAALTNLGNGTFTYSYVIPAGSAAGAWSDSCAITDTSRVSGTGSTTFSVSAPVNNHASLTWTGYSMCVNCHKAQAQAMYQSVHYQWKGSAAKMSAGPASQGKMDALDGSSALNAYCVNIQGNWGPCGACHVGTGAKPVATNNPTDAQLASIDCLMCHNDKSLTVPYSRKRNATTGLFEPVPTQAEMNLIVQKANIKPGRKNCLDCHAKAGGGDAVKRGDLALANGTTSDVVYDTHMAGGTGGNLACQACHTFTSHRVAGRGSDLRPLDSTVEVNCVNCHANKAAATGHVTTAVNKHIARVACQSCHIPVYGKNASDTAATEATETHREWTHAEWNAVLGRWEPTPTKANNLIPKYAFFNGTSWGNNLMDAAVIDPKTGKYKISRPNGAINDAGATTKLYPFKYKTANQPLNTTRNKLIALSTATYFATGNYTQAVLDGMASMGYAGDAWTTVTTDEYQMLNHSVPVAANVLACAACHPNASATQVKLVTEIGYGLKAPTTTVCVQCHNLKNPSAYDRMHSRHVDSVKADCSWCHTFSRPERGLMMP